jgi:hypothetical protein
VNTRLFDWIWQIRGSVAIVPGQSNDEAFRRLDPLFRTFGTTHERSSDTLTFQKKDQAAQDKMSIFDAGVLQIERGAAGAVLHYKMTSRMLLFCFLAPLMFVAFAQLTIYMGARQKAAAEAAGKPDKKPAKPVVVRELHPVDKFLGAPAPAKPKDGEETGRGKRKPSPTSAYVLAGLFALLYVFGRVFEARMVKSLFNKSLMGSTPYQNTYSTHSTA